MFWYHAYGRLRSSRSLLRAAVLSAFLSLTVMGGVARAGDDLFCVEQLVGVGQACYGATHSLTSVLATNQGTGSGCAGTYGYGSYYCADPTGCHTYLLGYQLTPGIRHWSTISAKIMRGEETYGSTGVAAGCVISVPFSVSGPLEDASAYLDGLPVIDRPTATAPADVAALVPSANPKMARTFTTPHGRAWVLVDPSVRSVCLVADDNGTGYGVSCQRYGAARDQGSIETFEGGDTASPAGDIVIALPPAGVNHIAIGRADGTSRNVAAVRGVVVETLVASDRVVGLDASPTAEAGVKGTRMSVGPGPAHRRY